MLNQINETLSINKNPNKKLIFVYSAPKVGSTSIVSSLRIFGSAMFNNIHIHDGISEQDFVAMRTARDATLEMPVLILPAVQINIRAGELPPKETNGVSYLKIPINSL